MAAPQKPRGIGEEVQKPFTPKPVDVVPEVTTVNAKLDLEASAHRTNQEVIKKDIARKKLGSVYRAEPQQAVMIAPQYASHFGKRMHVQINGVTVVVPCDGRPHMIPESFAMLVQRRLQYVNEQERKQRNIGEVASNQETSPGELTLY